MKNRTARLWLGFVVCLLFAVVMPMTVSAAASNISVYVDGTALTFDVPPMVVNQRTMLPLRAVFEFLGAEVEWIQEENGIRATTDTLDLYMQLGNPEMTVNGVVYPLDVAPFAVDGRTLIPVRAVSEAFSATVDWEQETSSVKITTYDERYARELDRSLTESYDPYHVQTSNGDVESVSLDLIQSRLRVTFKTLDPKIESIAIRINNGSLVGVTDLKDKKTGVRTAVATVNLSTLDIPDRAVVEVYTKNKGETRYYSYIYRCLYMEKDGQYYRFCESKMWEHNYAILSEWVDPREYLGGNIPDAVMELSNTICEGITDDYQKVLKLHDWVAENLYYDMDDYYNKGTHSFAGVEDLLINKHSVCQGYADLVTLLVRAQGIPCRQIYGYALGLSAVGYWTDDNMGRTKDNHAWNQVYVDHRWINIDATWDSDNVYENAEYVYGGIDYYLYFDVANYFLSYSHKILSIH